ncbi:phosphotransferase [Agrococcus sp. SGAir0287]|uniref:phosphotransferase n=1 Tax=Agrococcus sp. SGAir0287 TaxID=2070347 RepID=UPI0010CCE846|nr:phosphotransferase [Agrococcus sp. SGAir0287]QCR18884.1 macrolide 2'-phosphotransferase [Agrococcus sp. SGAir0287]
MAANPFTLAALATSAVPGIEVVGAVDDGSDEDLEAVAARVADGRVVRVVVPRTPEALRRLRDQAVTLSVFSRAVRDRLPFEVPETLGTAPLQRTAVVVSTRLGGATMRLADVSPAHLGIAASIGEAIAALHDLPTSVVVDAGLPHRTTAEIRDALVAVFDRGAETGRVPAALLARWETALDDAALWQFQPRVVHGDLQAPAFRREHSTITGIDGWHALGLGDPAIDLAWLLGSEHGSSVDEAFVAYAGIRGADRHLRRRAMLHAELDVARWLLHGVDAGDAAIVADAEGMLARLAERVADDDATTALQPERLHTMDLADVQHMLDERGTSTPRDDAHRRSQAREQETVELDGVDAARSPR